MNTEKLENLSKDLGDQLEESGFTGLIIVNGEENASRVSQMITKDGAFENVGSKHGDSMKLKSNASESELLKSIDQLYKLEYVLKESLNDLNEIGRPLVSAFAKKVEKGLPDFIDDTSKIREVMDEKLKAINLSSLDLMKSDSFGCKALNTGKLFEKLLSGFAEHMKDVIKEKEAAPTS